MAKAEDWHKIVSVNDVVKDAKGMAQELCRHKITAVSFAGNQQAAGRTRTETGAGCPEGTHWLLGK